jgi:hypothetical protein
MTIRDVAYIATIVLVCIGVKFSNVSLTTILTINGTILGFACIYVLPIGLHVKCIFFTQPSPLIELINMQPIQSEKY